MLPPKNDSIPVCHEDDPRTAERDANSTRLELDNLIGSHVSSEPAEAFVAASETTEIVSASRTSEAAGSRLKGSNRRIALTLLALAAVFFAGTIFTRLSGNSRIGLMFLGAAILLFLVTAIGRNLRK